MATPDAKLDWIPIGRRSKLDLHFFPHMIVLMEIINFKMDLPIIFIQTFFDSAKVEVILFLKTFNFF